MNKLTIKKLILAIQHLVSSFGSLVLVPILVGNGMSTSVALFAAGIGTLIFHKLTKNQIPIFLGSSFAFITSLQFISNKYNLAYAEGGIVVAGICYILFAVLVHFVGTEKIKLLFPPLITGTMIIIIGLTLAPSVLNGNIVNGTVGTLGQRWLISAIVILTVVIISMFTKGFIKLLPILCGIGVGYLVSILFGFVDASVVSSAKWVEIPPFILPKFNMESALIIASISIVTFMEHIGDITTVGSVVGRDFIKDIGLTRTLLGDGIATMFAGFVGAPVNTTYSENTGVLAITKVYDPSIIRVAAIIAILLSFIGKLGVLLQAIPSPVIGGISIILFGMIASTGLKTLVDAKIDFGNSRNSIIVAIMLVIGLSGVVLPIGSFQLAGLSLSALIGVILNRVLPTEK